MDYDIIQDKIKDVCQEEKNNAGYAFKRHLMAIRTGEPRGANLSPQRQYKRGQQYRLEDSSTEERTAVQNRGQQYRIENSIYRGRTAIQKRVQQYIREDSRAERRTTVQNTVLNG